MKTRNGYVSNSSSTSFCIAGVRYSKDKFNILLCKLDAFDCIDRFFDASHESVYDFDASNCIDSMIGPLRAFYDQNESSEYIGLRLDEMKPDETRDGFLARAFSLLQEIGYNGKERDVSFITGSYRV